MRDSKMLGEEKISKLLLKFSIPGIVGMLVNALYNVVDSIFIGRGVGPLGIAGVAIAFPLMIIAMGFSMLIGIGATSLISIKLGEHKKDEAELIAANGFSLLVIIGLALSIVSLVFLDPILMKFGASEAVMPYARDFTRIILWGNVFQSVSFGMNSFIRAEGNPKMAMSTMLIGAILNTILNPIFIFVLHWGVKGSAAATIISQAGSTAWVLSYFLGGRSLNKLHLKNMKPRWTVTAGIMAIGIAPFAMQIAASVLSVIMNRSLMHYGDDIAISGMGVINRLAMLVLMPIFGINQGAQPILGYNYGARKYDRVKQALKLAIFAATAIVTVGFIITRLFPHQLIALFSENDPELISFGAHALQVFLIFLPIIGFQIVSANYFQATGKPKQAMLLSLSRQVLLLIPALLILPLFFGLEGVLWAGPVSDLGSSILTGIVLYYELKKLDKRHSETSEQDPEPVLS